jgi:lipopolysaccharide export system protein LptC
MSALRDSQPVPRAKTPPRLSLRDGYSLFVGTLKVVLPALVVALVLTLVVWPRLVPDEAEFRISVSELDPGEVDNLTMVNPRYRGVDEENRPFTVVADKAVQDRSGADIVDLQRPQADLTTKDGAWITLSARDGRYDRASKHLHLEEDVSLFHDRGFEVHTSVADADLKAGTAHGDRPTRGHGPSGQIEGEGFRILDRGARIIFTGKSQLIIRESELEGGQ